MRQSLRHCNVHGAVLQQRGADDDLLGSGLQHLRGGFDRADSAANLHRKVLADVMNEGRVFAFAHGRIQVDQLHRRIGKKAVDPVLKVVEFERLLFALHQLDNLAAHEID